MAALGQFPGWQKAASGATLGASSATPLSHSLPSRHVGKRMPISVEVVMLGVALTQSPACSPCCTASCWKGRFSIHTLDRICFLALPCGMQDLSSPARDRTLAPCSGSAGS